MSIEIPREIGSLTEDDLKLHRVWEFKTAENSDGYGVVRVLGHPVISTVERIIATQVTLANGTKLWATAQGFVRGNRRETENWLSLSILFDGKHIFLGDTSMYRIPEYSPEAVARQLGLEMHEVFPIHFDVRESVSGYDDGAFGTIRGVGSP